MGANSEPKTKLVFRDGRLVFVPHVDKNRIVNRVHKWEQAFRVYAAIYSQANPDRSAEIWQYVFTINTAAASYAWTNVAEYDFTFRQMMSKNPKWSWSKIYTQMWNLCLTESLHSRNFKPGFGGQNNGQRTSSISGPSTSGQKPSYCWKYNCNSKCKFGNNCKFVNKCSYCDSSAHGLYNCPKKNASELNQEFNNAPNH